MRLSCCAFTGGLLLLVACGRTLPYGPTSSPLPDDDAGTPDGGSAVDAGGRDGGLPDAGPVDGGVMDAGAPDAGAPDAGAFDAGGADGGVADAGVRDAGSPDAGTPDSGEPDAGVADAGASDSGVPDAGAPDAGAFDAGGMDSGTPDAGGQCTLMFGSGPTWTVYQPDSGVQLGPAQDVCLNAFAPSGCPAGAFLYGYPGAGWMAEPSNLNGAEWTWAPGIAVTDDADLAHYVFQWDFVLAGPATGWIQLGADDFAQVRVNGLSVGTVGSITNMYLAGQAHSVLTQFQLPMMRAGPNTITVDGMNAAWPNLGCNPCDYAQNPAGVLFGGTIQCTGAGDAGCAGLGLSSPAFYAAALGPSSVAAGDIRGLGIADVVSLNQFSNSLDVFFNDGFGPLTLAATYATGGQPIGIALGDLNGDGLLDIVVGNFDDDSVGVFLNTGAGQFQPMSAFPAGLAPISVAIGDLDGDGRPDVAVANNHDSTVGVLMGTGNGSLAPQVTYSVGPAPYGVVQADFNQDGLLDLASADVDGNVAVLLNLGGGILGNEQFYPAGVSSQGLAVGDLNHDGFPDLVVANTGTGTSESSVGILLNNQNGTFAPVASYASDPYTRAVVIGDFNEDGSPDVLAVNYADGTLGLFINSGSGTFAPQQILGQPISNAVTLAVADLNGDGHLDVVIGTYQPSVDVAVLLRTCGP